MFRVPLLDDDLINAQKSGGDPLAKTLMYSIKLNLYAYKRVKVEGPFVNGHLSVTQQEAVLSSMILPWIQATVVGLFVPAS